MQPLEFHPILKRIRWGGTRLGAVLGKPIGDAVDFAESWEIADHGDDQSVAAKGPYAGWTLRRLVAERERELFGRQAGRDQFPLLIKFLDAHDRLSLQVHPDDRLAIGYDPLENGKTETWVILDARPGSRIYAGLKTGVDRRRLERSLDGGNIEECLHRFTAGRGDCVFIPAGTVHAIGEGILLAEIQQSSDLTFRLHDWGRLGSDGKPRPLHVNEALCCIDFDRGPVDPVVPQVISKCDHPVEELVRCDYFVLRRHRTEKPFVLSPDERFHIVMVLAGSARMVCGTDRTHLTTGQTVLLPASCPDVHFAPTADLVLLETFVP